jgi:hypothetical protein
MVYDAAGRIILDKTYNQYISVAYKFKIPMLNLAPNWRANPEHIKLARFKDKNLNADCVGFLNKIRNQRGHKEIKVLIGGVMACKGEVLYIKA